MVDLHCHILPDIDDGPKTLAESLNMCLIAEGDGISTIVATPHLRPGQYETRGVDQKVRMLQEVLDTRGIKVKILQGADITVTPELFRYLQTDISLTVNSTGKYFLAELPYDAVPLQWESYLLSFKGKGYSPILTHPERISWFLRNPDALCSFVMAGGLVQITAMSVTGEAGANVKEYCHSLITRNLAHVIATDAHSSLNRPPLLSDAFRVASELIGEPAARRLVNSNPKTIIDGGDIQAPEPVMQVPRRRRWYRKIMDW